MRLVMDTDVVYAALASATGASRRILTMVLDGELVAVASVPLLFEYEAVLKRPQSLVDFGIGVSMVDTVMDALAAMLEEVDVHYLLRPALRDPNDNMVLEAAVNGYADAIVTFNRRDFGAVPSRYGIRVDLPGELLRRLRE